MNLMTKELKKHGVYVPRAPEVSSSASDETRREARPSITKPVVLALRAIVVVLAAALLWESLDGLAAGVVRHSKLHRATYPLVSGATGQPGHSGQAQSAD